MSKCLSTQIKIEDEKTRQFPKIINLKERIVMKIFICCMKVQIQRMKMNSRQLNG